jgi:hypothetical protein
MSSLPSIEGTISSQPWGNTIAGTMPRGNCSGSIAAPITGTLPNDSSESPEYSAVAELGSLISGLGSLSAQAQSLPLSPPTLPGLPQSQGYQPQATDYMQLSDESN